MTQWDAVYQRMLLGAATLLPEHIRRLQRARRAVAIARELTVDADEHGRESGRDADGWSRGEAADAEWCLAVLLALRLLLGAES